MKHFQSPLVLLGVRKNLYFKNAFLAVLGDGEKFDF